MPFIIRKDGVVTGLFTMRQAPDQEHLPDDHPEVLAYHERDPLNPANLPDPREVLKTMIQDILKESK